MIGSLSTGVKEVVLWIPSQTRPHTAVPAGQFAYTQNIHNRASGSHWEIQNKAPETLSQELLPKAHSLLAGQMPFTIGC